MDMEFIRGVMEIGMRGSGNHVSSMAMVQTSFLTEIFILAIIKMENLMAMANIFGLLEVVMSEISKKASNMEKESSRIRREPFPTHTKANITMMLNKEKESSGGQAEMCMLVATKMMKETDKEK